MFIIVISIWSHGLLLQHNTDRLHRVKDNRSVLYENEALPNEARSGIISFRAKRMFFKFHIEGSRHLGIINLGLWGSTFIFLDYHVPLDLHSFKIDLEVNKYFPKWVPKGPNGLLGLADWLLWFGGLNHTSCPGELLPVRPPFSLELNTGTKMAINLLGSHAFKSKLTCVQNSLGVC